MFRYWPFYRIKLLPEVLSMHVPIVILDMYNSPEILTYPHTSCTHKCDTSLQSLTDNIVEKLHFLFLNFFTNPTTHFTLLSQMMGG